MFWILDWDLNSFCVLCFGFWVGTRIKKTDDNSFEVGSKTSNSANEKDLGPAPMNKHGHPSRDLAQDYTAADSTQDYTAADLSVFGSIPVQYPLKVSRSDTS